MTDSVSSIRAWMGAVRASVLAAAVAVGAWALPATAQDLENGDPDFLSFGAGGFDVFDDKTTAAFQLEYASDRRFWVFHPIVGTMINADGGGNVYAGVGIDLFFGSRIVVTPSFAPSAYWRGSSKDLGHVLEFRSAISAAYRFDDRSRLGLEFYHLSNAGLDEHNPGTEVLLLKYSLPFTRSR